MTNQSTPSSVLEGLSTTPASRISTFPLHTPSQRKSQRWRGQASHLRDLQHFLPIHHPSQGQTRRLSLVRPNPPTNQRIPSDPQERSSAPPSRSATLPPHTPSPARPDTPVQDSKTSSNPDTNQGHPARGQTPLLVGGPRRPHTFEIKGAGEEYKEYSASVLDTTT